MAIKSQQWSNAQFRLRRRNDSFFSQKNRWQGLTKTLNIPIVQRNNVALHKGDKHEPAD
jgi:hypothetical protein